MLTKYKHQILQTIREAGLDPTDFFFLPDYVDPELDLENEQMLLRKHHPSAVETADKIHEYKMRPDVTLLQLKKSLLIFSIEENPKSFHGFNFWWTTNEKTFPSHHVRDYHKIDIVLESLTDWLIKQVIPYIEEQKAPDPFDAFTNPDDTPQDPVNFTHLTPEQKQEHPTPEQREKMPTLLQSVKDAIQELRAAGVPAENPLLQTINANLERLETIQAQGTEGTPENASDTWTSYEWSMLLLAMVALLVQLATMFAASTNIDLTQFEFNIHLEILETFPQFRLPGDNLLPDTQ